MAGTREHPTGTWPGRGASDGYHLSPCREGAMTTLHVRALSTRAGALLAAVAVLAAGCAAAGGGSGPPAGRAEAAQDAVAASASSHSFAHRTARTTGRSGRSRRSSAATTTRPLPLFQCEQPMGRPVVSPAGAASHSRPVISACPCCGWCSCARACCGCGPGRWPPRWWPRSHLAWLCCARWHWPPSEGAALIPLACEPGCRSFACPAGGAGTGTRTSQSRSGFSARTLPRRRLATPTHDWAARA